VIHPLSLILALQTLPVGAARPPATDTVLATDALVVDSLHLGEGQSRWPFEFVRTVGEGSAAPAETWVHLQDPYGGSFFGPLTIVASLGEKAVAFSEDRLSRSVLFLPRSLTLSALGLILVGIVTAGAFPVVLYRRRYRRERDRRRAIEMARHHLAEGREAERLRFARDLHDGPVQDLQALRMRLSLIALVPDRKGVEEVVAEVQRVVLDLRQTSEDLRPPTLSPFGLAVALRASAARFEQAHPEVDLDLDLDADGQSLSESVRLGLYRIAQEAITNAARHGRPSQITVSLRIEPAAVSLEVTDDGTGYVVPDDLAAPVRPGHYGLVGMAERAAALRGTLNVQSELAVGTRVQVRVPALASDSSIL
jgi:signal transduction histidine kinase